MRGIDGSLRGRCPSTSVLLNIQPILEDTRNSSATSARRRRLLTHVLPAITFRVECAEIPDVPAKVCVANLYCAIVVLHEDLQT